MSRYSYGSTVNSTALYALSERQRKECVRYDDPVIETWPEYAAFVAEVRAEVEAARTRGLMRKGCRVYCSCKTCAARKPKTIQPYRPPKLQLSHSRHCKVYRGLDPQASRKCVACKGRKISTAPFKVDRHDISEMGIRYGWRLKPYTGSVESDKKYGLLRREVA